MEDKLVNFLNIIHMDKDIQEQFRGVLLKKVVVSKSQDYIAIFLSTNKMISIETYLELKTRTHDFFNSNISINIENNGDKSLYLDEYFKYFLPKYITTDGISALSATALSFSTASHT